MLNGVSRMNFDFNDLISLKREFMLMNNDKVVFTTDASQRNEVFQYQATGKTALISNEIPRKEINHSQISFNPKDSDMCRKMVETMYPDVDMRYENLIIKCKCGTRILEFYFCTFNDKETGCCLVTDNILDITKYTSKISISKLDELIEEAMCILEDIDIEALETKWGIKSEERMNQYEREP